MSGEKDVTFKTFNHFEVKKNKVNNSSKLYPTKKDIKKYDSKSRVFKKILFIIAALIAFVPWALIISEIIIFSFWPIFLSLTFSGFILGFEFAILEKFILETKKDEKYTKRFELLSKNEEELNLGLQNPQVNKEQIEKVIGKSASKKFKDKEPITVTSIQNNRLINYKKLKKILDYIKESTQTYQEPEEKLERKLKNE